MTARPRAILADDERLRREQLLARLREVWPELEIVGEARNGAEAVALVEQHKPDLAFLDIRMPGLTGLDAAREIGGRCHIVFITAYDEYAVEAFEHGALDYVLKPAERERLSTTVARLKKRLADPAPAPDLSTLLADLSSRLQKGIGDAVAAPPPAQPREAHLQWIQASIGQELRMIPVEEILFFTSDEKYTRVQTATQEALIRKPIKELIDSLDPEQFWQIHRSTLVNVKAIAGVTRDFRGRQLVRINGTNEKLEVSRSYAHLFKQM
ncbi:LytTR family DNA-binding domain-containing protein [soil metagenome]